MIHVLRHERDENIEGVTDVEMKKYPTLKDAFLNFQTHREWNWYKKDIRDEVIEKKHQIHK